MLLATSETNHGYYTRRWIKVWDTETQNIVAQTLSPPETPEPHIGSIPYSDAEAWIKMKSKELGKPIFTLSYKGFFEESL